ncbi:MAG: alpha/beta fold hydrolase [Mycobacteriaceae bacterium]|nr:alpha/beta fold hydrolase [Mycobacteriaceae bacterium]
MSGGVLAGGGANWLITGESGLRWSDFTTGAFTGILGEVIGGASRTVHAGIHTRSAGSIAAGPDAAAPQPGLTAANLTAANLTEVDSGAATTTPAPTPDDVNIEPMPDDVNIEPIPDDVDTPIPTLSEAGARAAEPGPPSGRLSTEAAERIATLDKRHTHMVIGLAQLAREWPGIPWSGTATSAELETLTTAIGSVRSSGVVGPEPAPGPIELAIQAKMDEKTLDRVGDELVRYVLDERDTNAAATHESAGPRLDRMLQRLHDRPGLLHDGRTQDIETLVSAIRWTDQLALPDRRMPLLPEDGVTMADVELYRRQAADAFADAPGWSPANAIDESPAAREVRQHRARSLGHVGALPRDWVRPVVEEPGNRDLTAVSKLFAARMPDGRTVYVRVAGDPDGFPVLLSPGTPVGVDGALPDYKMLYDQGFCLIIVERPGYGESDPLPARSVADCARDIIHIAVELFAFDTYAVLGRSGGGSVGIATGALDPTHVARVVSVVGTSPVVTDIEGWTAHMGQPNKDGYKAVRELALRTRESGRSLLEFNDPSFHVPDHMFIGVNQWRLARGYERALAKSVDTSWVADAAQLKAPWGISFADYPVPIDLVHGVDDGAGVRDEFSPVSHSRINAALIERAQLHLIPGIAHMSGMDLAPVLCRYLSAERDAYFETATWIPRERAERIQAKAAAPLELPTWAFWTHGKWHERFGRPANSPEFLRIDRDGR